MKQKMKFVKIQILLIIHKLIVNQNSKNKIIPKQKNTLKNVLDKICSFTLLMEMLHLHQNQKEHLFEVIKTQKQEELKLRKSKQMNQKLKNKKLINKNPILNQILLIRRVKPKSTNLIQNQKINLQRLSLLSEYFSLSSR